MYQYARMYHEDDEFFSRWQNMRNVPSGIIFVRKEQYIWLEGITMSIPLAKGQFIFFDGKYGIIRNDEGHIWLAVWHDDEEQADG